MSRSPRSGPQAPTSKTTRPGSFNHDFSQRVVLHTADLPWLASPMAGVERRMLAGAIAAAFLGFLIGIVTLRLRGIFAACLAWFFGLALMGLTIALGLVLFRARSRPVLTP